MDSSGDRFPPCGTPSSLARTNPSSIIPLFSIRTINRSTRCSRACANGGAAAIAGRLRGRLRVFHYGAVPPDVRGLRLLRYPPEFDALSFVTGTVPAGVQKTACGDNVILDATSIAELVDDPVGLTIV